ncbi:MAG: ammonium transporter [Alphaproteobacteria bacterium]
MLIDPALAQEAAAASAPKVTVNKADDAWMMVASLLVLMMTVPGLALFYGGMVRPKNMLSIITQVLAIQAIVCVVWFLWGYSFAFTEIPKDSSLAFLAPFVGGAQKLFLSGVSAESLADTFTDGVKIHELVFVCFQMTFAAITTALVIGGFAERMKFSAVVLFAVIWPTFIYFPIAHMVWGSGGFLLDLGALDFAGGTVVHINAGIAGFVGALLLGKRIGFKKEPMPPHSLAFTMVGASLLWVGWFGFNAGSALEANGSAVLAMANTFVATAAAGVSWMLVEWLIKGKPSLLGLASGVVAGLVAVTPAAGSAGPMGELILGLIAGAGCFFFCTSVKSAFGYDDTLDVFGVHAVGGMIGAIGTGIVHSPALGGQGGADFNMMAQVFIQIEAVVLTIIWSGVGSFIVYMIIGSLVGLRVSEETEREGLDIAEHGERAYNM